MASWKPFPIAIEVLIFFSPVAMTVKSVTACGPARPKSEYLLAKSGKKETKTAE